MIGKPPDPRVALVFMIFLAIALASWTWQQGYYAVYSLAIFGLGYYVAFLAISIDETKKRM